MKSKILKCRCASIQGKLGEVEYNANQIIKEIKTSAQEQVDILAFSEMALTGYSCGDILFNQYLHENIIKSIFTLVCATRGIKTLVVLGSPLKVGSKIYDCAVALQNGSILAVIPKAILDVIDGREARWISVPENMKTTTIDIFEFSIPFSPLTMFYDKNSGVSIGVTVGQDFEKPISIGGLLVENGVNIIINISAAHETTNYNDYIKNMVRAASAQKKCAYIYVTSGRMESTTDGVFSDYCAICENGTCLAERDVLFGQDETITACIDIDAITQVQTKNIKSSCLSVFSDVPTSRIPIKLLFDINEQSRIIAKEPFLDGLDIDVVCRRVVEIQSAAILQKIRYSGRNKLIIGISGGLDSTVALLACCYALKKSDIPLSNIIGVTMPGPGTTERTYKNSCALMRSLGVTALSIDINSAVIAHLQNINHQEGLFDITYEQTQSRERTKILMDLANKEKGIVIGTGDMSEFALGWMSYSGDQISMYGLNSGIPKTIIKHLAKYYLLNSIDELKMILQDIVETPVSPELLPVSSDGTQKQKTEDLVGPYIVHDFFLYYFVKYAYSPIKILELAQSAFSDIYTETELKAWMKTFITRFYTRQFKRTCFPDGCQVFDVSLSPRNGWVMPSDVYNETLLNCLENDV